MTEETHPPIDLFDPPFSYKLVSKAGRGSFGTVFRAEPATVPNAGEYPFPEIAIKLIPDPDWKNPGRRSSRFARLLIKLEANFERLKKLENPHVIKLHGYKVLSETNLLPERVAIAMEYCAGENLAERIRRGALSWKEVIAITKQVVLGLICLHSNNITHADISPKNIFLVDQNWVDPEINVKLVDLDGSSHSVNVSAVGTPRYFSPEMRAKINSTQQVAVSSKTDIWSLGRVLQDMAYSTVRSVARVGWNIHTVGECENGPYDKETLVIHGMSCNHFSAVTDLCLAETPEQRGSAEQVFKCELLKKGHLLDTNGDLRSCLKCSTTTEEIYSDDYSVADGPEGQTFALSEPVKYYERMIDMIGRGEFSAVYLARLSSKPPSPEETLSIYTRSPKYPGTIEILTLVDPGKPGWERSLMEKLDRLVVIYSHVLLGATDLEYKMRVHIHIHVMSFARATSGD